MELRHLRYFVAVAEEMNIHRAATRLHVSQPPLSVAIKQLEEEIGTPLFYREGRGIQITKAGEYFLNQARNILSQAQEATQNALQIGEGKQGLLRVRFINSAVTGILQNSVALFQKEHPAIVLDIKQFYTIRAIEAVQQNKADVAIVRYPQRLPNTVQSRKITKDHWAIAMPDNHPLTQKKEIEFKDLETLPLIFYPRWNSPDGYDDVAAMFREQDMDFNPIHEVTEQTAIAGLVSSGIGVGLVPGRMAQILFQGVTHRPLKHTKGRTGFMCITRQITDDVTNTFVTCADRSCSYKRKKA